MNLGKNINNLLKRYSEVYVRGLGVFKKKHSPAQFDKQRDLFLPPISYLEFDAKSEQGFNFIHYIQQQQNLNLDAATHVLEQAVADLNDQLRQQGQAKLEDLGHIVSYGSSLVFKPLDISGFNYEPIPHQELPEIETVIPDRELEEIIPLPIVPEEKISEEEDVAAVAPIQEVLNEEAAVSTVVPTVKQESAEQALPVVDEYSELETEAPAKSATIWYYITAAIIIIVAVVVAFLLNPELKEQLFGSQKPEKVVATPAVKSIPSVDTSLVTIAADSLKRDTVATDTVSSLVQHENVPAGLVKESIPTAKPNYQLVISGSHKTIETAEAEAAALRAKGYTTVRAVEGKFKRNKKKVIWDFYMTKDEADRDQATVVKTFKGAWVEKLSK